jgi:hypothetical protein
VFRADLADGRRVLVRADPIALSTFTPVPLTAVSVGEPFADSTDDHPESKPETLSSDREIEPRVVVDPTNADHLVGLRQQDRWSIRGSRGITFGVSFDGGGRWQEVVASGLSRAAALSRQALETPALHPNALPNERSKPPQPVGKSSSAHATSRAVLDNFFAELDANLEADIF